MYIDVRTFQERLGLLHVRKMHRTSRLIGTFICPVCGFTFERCLELVKPFFVGNGYRPVCSHECAKYIPQQVRLNCEARRKMVDRAIRLNNQLTGS